ncbi:S24/S26 family peptidase [Candidatus Poribacteria bacterium]|nr:S24/S26 family peptidase [Candidatus Poribacteria bacterium]
MIPQVHLETVLDIWQERGEKSACSIEGNCMSPMIREGDTLVIKHGDKHIRAGDIVVFASCERNLVCRVIRSSAENGALEYLVKADQELHTQLISPDRIVGKVIEIAGSNGRLRLNSLFWKMMNRALATRSYLVFKRSRTGSPFRSRLTGVFRSPLRSLVEPWPVGRVFWGWILHAYHAWHHIEKIASGKAGEWIKGVKAWI